MKNCLLILIVLSFAMTAFAQAPQSFQYQAVVRNATGDVVADQMVGIRISLHAGPPAGSGSGSMVYQETHTPTSNSFGLVNLQIGTGTVVSGTFSSISWGMGPHFIEVEVDPAGGTNYTVMGSSQLLSVPYALYAESSNCITDGYYRGDTLKLIRTDGSVINILPCGVDLSSQVTFNCLEGSEEEDVDLVDVAISYTGMDENAVIVNNGMGAISGDNPATTPNGTILVTGLREGDSWNFTLTGGLSGSCLLESSGTVPSDYCVPCGITSLATQVNVICETNNPGDNNDQVFLEISYTGVDPDVMVINNGNGTIAGYNPATDPSSFIFVTGLMVGDSWDISVVGGASGTCNFSSTGTFSPADLCDPCGITSIENGSQVSLPGCQTNTPGYNNDQLAPLVINYTGIDPYAVVVNNGPGTLDLSGGNPATDMDGAIKINGLKEGDTWNIAIIGGINNSCSFHSIGTIPFDHCSDPIDLLGNGYTPCQIVSAGQPEADLYGIMHQGGLIFHVDVNANPCFTLASAPGDAYSLGLQWGCVTLDISTGTAVGTGSSNSAIIGALGCSQPVAEIYNYSFGGYTDYFMPSKDELQLMYTNLHALGYGNFTTIGSGYYWSSSQATPTKAWCLKFTNNLSAQLDKSGVYGRVRGIRKL